MRRQSKDKPPLGEVRYIPPRVTCWPAGLATVIRIHGKKVYYKLHGDDGEHWTLREEWANLPYTSPEPVPARMDDWIGRQVINRHAITTGVTHFPAGTRFIVRSHHRGRLNLAMAFGSGSVHKVAKWEVYLVAPGQILGRMAVIAPGVIGEGRVCAVLGEPFTCGGQQWVPVRWTGEEDPDVFKLSGLKPA